MAAMKMMLPEIEAGFKQGVLDIICCGIAL